MGKQVCLPSSREMPMPMSSICCSWKSHPTVGDIEAKLSPTSSHAEDGETERAAAAKRTSLKASSTKRLLISR